MHKSVTEQVKNVQSKKVAKGQTPKLFWWQLSLIGIGSVIGAGFFLGSGLAIHAAGPSVLVGYILSGLIAFFVFQALGKMTVHDPQPGSFRTYARQAFGHSLGFMSGWIYWIAGVLIMSSEVTALAIFSQLWFPHIPLWVFAILYSALALLINMLGVKNFGSIESFFAVIKIATLLAFVGFGTLALTGVVTPTAPKEMLSSFSAPFFANGFLGFWSSLIFVLFSYGGIEVVGVLANELKRKTDITKAGTFLVVVLTSLYAVSIFFILKLVSFESISSDQSPFVYVLSHFSIPYLDSLFNVILISAAFSTMVGALFSITSIMISLSLDGDAPASLHKPNQHGVAWRALFLSGIGLAVTVVASYVLPNTVYEYLTAAAGIMLLLNWVIILSSHIKKGRELEHSTPLPSFLGIALIVFTIAGSLIHSHQRIGFFIAIGFAFLILCAYGWRARKGSYNKL
ncbi:amino acid permease [Fictibacillus macauensis ZFHKF-1]|uniref:Amino acid permease n=1 Tax=Fictibacillus macauensis ZFHKF-1 TaxID=1196324 RepID=I8AM12_9BACL|nr:amino acid permease [Fictibacillus macauensis]EIT86962.1 amino acid permease [Fictibacillus macauensis ZFHKF-1]